jgi:hypothetical protein
MEKSELKEIKKGKFGTGLLIENDGYISLDTEKNKYLKESYGGNEWHVPYPFIVHAVFQKAGIKNANGRVYPRDILEKQVEEYQKKIKEHMALGECYKPNAEILTVEGWKELSDVKKNMKVLSYNLEKKVIEIKKIEKVIELDFDGELITMQGRGINDVVTPNHMFPMYKNGKYMYSVTAEKLSNHSVNWQDKLKIPTLDKDISVKGITYGTEEYKGKVMCVEVADNHTWYVRCGGKEHWTHNCNHPSDSTIDLGRISHNIIELHWEGNTVVGQMELNITEGFRRNGICSSYGDTIANLLLNGYKIGVSSRGVGSVENRMGVAVVGNDFELICWDVVSEPSTPLAYIGLDKSELETYIESDVTKSSKSVMSEKIEKMKNILNEGKK